MNHIYKNIYLGDSQDHKQADELLKHNISYILNVAVDLSIRPLVCRDYKAGLIDGPGNEYEDYTRACFLAYSLFITGRNLLIHCHEGKSRSAFIALILIASDLLESDGRKSNDVKQEAMDILIKGRPIVNINESHFDVYGQLVVDLFINKFKKD